MSDDEDSWRQRDEEARRELEQIRLEMDRKTDQSVESTRNMVRMAEQSTQQGAATLVNLQEQGDQIKRAETRLDEANEGLKEATRNLDDLEKCCGCCVMPWNRGGRMKQARKANSYGNIDNKDGQKRTKADKKKEKQVAKEAKKKEKNNGAVAVVEEEQDVEYVQRITNDEREDEMNKNLKEVHELTTGLKSMALDMYSEVSRQNDDIDRLRDKTQVMDDQVHIADKRANKIVKKM